jgi:predicted Zn-dependent protease
MFDRTVYGFRNLALLLLLLAPAAYSQAQQVAANDPEQQTAEEKHERKLTSLIEQLGSDEYATRQSAKADLEKLGLDAFNALFKAQDHADIEIALAARFLIRSMNIQWAQDDDPEEARKILEDYGSQPAEKRRDLMERLAALDKGWGLVPLSRIIRYESDGSLAKQAAILMLNVPRPSEEKTADKWAEGIRKTIGNSRRAAAAWALAYADTLQNAKDSLANWDQLISQEHETLLSYPEKSDREIVRKLMRWHAELLIELEKREEAVAVMRKSINLLESERTQILAWIDWLILHDAPELIDEIATRFDDTFAKDPELLYRLAENYLQQAKTDEANATAARARKIQPENFIEHYNVASKLKQRQQFEWAELEYRVILDNNPEASPQNISTRLVLAEMLHDVQRDKDAAEVLQKLVTLAEEDAAVRQALAQRERTLDEVKSRMNFFYSAHLLANANVEEAMKKLNEGFEADPYDVDLLIAMYRLQTEDAAFKEKTMTGLKAAIAHYKNDITKYEKLFGGNNRNIRMQLSSNLVWAMACNQYAWLVANTEGDYQDAIKQSHKSLELRPDSASFLDTLGRCYYAAGDLKNAVKYQREAVEIDPSTNHLKRQLEQFEAELAKQKSEG